MTASRLFDQATAKAPSTNAVLRIQPVAPEPPRWPTIWGEVLGHLLVLALGAWFVCLGTAAAHDYWPVVPPLGYWASVAMLLALSTIRHTLTGSAWKWARR